MIRSRVPKYKRDRARNLQNLHVIPTASVENMNLRQLKPALPTFKPAVIEITPAIELNRVEPTKNFFNQNKQNFGTYKQKFNKQRKKRQRGKKAKPFPAKSKPVAQRDSFSWFDYSVFGQQPKKDEPKAPPQKVETKTSPQKKEAKSPPQTETEKTENAPDAQGEENYFEEVEVASVEAEPRHETLVRYRKTKPYYLRYKKKGLFKPKFYNMSEPTFVNCLNVQEDVDVDIVSEAEYDYETDNLERSDSQENLNKIIEVADSDDTDEQMDEKETTQDSDIAVESLVTSRTYKICMDGNAGFTQGKSIVQKSLDSWKSHLIGLEYMIEIQNATKDSVKKYHCVLCAEDVDVQEFPAICLMNHISCYKHVIKYLEKHFPAYGYKFTTKKKHNIVHIQKFAEEVNNTLGYYCMCVSNLEYFIKNEQKVKEIIRNAYHPNENDFVLDKDLFLQKVNTDLKEEIEGIINNIIEKAVLLSVTPKVEPSEKIPKSTQSNLKVSATNADSVGAVSAAGNVSNVSDESKTKKKRPNYIVYKGHSALTSYMALSMVAKTALKKPGKKKSNAANKASDADMPANEKALDGTAQKVVQNTSSATVKNVTNEAKKNLNLKAKKNVTHEAKENLNLKSKKNVTHEVKENLNLKAKKNVTHEAMENLNLKTKEDIKEAEKKVIHEALEAVSPESLKDAEDFDNDIAECVDDEAMEDADCEEAEENEEQDDDSSAAAVPTVIESDADQKGHKVKEKVHLKTSTMHSKYCRKRILGKESSRLKLSVRASAKAGVSGVSKKCSVKHKSITPSVSVGASNKIAETNIEKVRLVKAIKSSSQKKAPVHKIPSVQKTPADSKSSATKHSSTHHRTVHKKENENSTVDQSSVAKSSPSVWKPLAKTSRSPVTSIDSTRVLKSPSEKQPRSPGRRTARKISRSPGKRIKSPLKHVIKVPIISPMRKQSRSPLRRKSRSPIRKKSRSPVRRQSRSPLRHHARSPVRRQSKSPLRHQARSPLRRRSRSPLRRRSRSSMRRRSRSPLRLRSRSPLRLRSRSPLRQRSRSPLRLRSRSPLRFRSRSPLRRHSRSPLRRRSRSPVRRYSRSPMKHHSRSSPRRHSRSPLRYHSRSPLRRQSRSPVKRRSRSPDSRRHSRSPLEKISKLSDKYRSSHRVHSPDFGRSQSNQKHFGSAEERSPINIYNYDKHLGSLSEFSKVKEACNMLNASKRNAPEKYKSHSFPHTSSRAISDLDPVSDEDESLYFSDKNQRMEDISPSSKMMLNKLLQKFSMADVNPSDPALNKLLQFMEAHSAEIQDLIGSQHKSDNINATKMNSTLQERSLFLQQYLLSNLAGSSQEPRFPNPALAMASKFAQLPFLHIPPVLGHPTNMPPPTITQPVQPVQQRFFPPNVTVPPPHIFHQINQPRQEFLPKLHQLTQPRQEFTQKPNVPPEVMFKDLKATVNKLFGANETAMKQEKHQMPGYVTEPDPEKWDLNHPSAPKFNTSVGSKNMFNPQGQSHAAQNPGVREEIPMFNTNNPPHGQFFGNRGPNPPRPQVPGVPIPPPDAKVSFCEVSRNAPKGNLFPVVNAHANPNFSASGSRSGVSDVKVSLAQRLASVLVKVGMIDVPAPLLQEMLMKIGAFSSSPRQDISEAEIISILKRLGYLS